MNNKMRIISEEFTNETTGENITGLTLMLDGKIKQVFDIMVQKSGGTKTYLDIMQEALISGINSQIQKLRDENKNL